MHVHGGTVGSWPRDLCDQCEVRCRADVTCKLEERERETDAGCECSGDVVGRFSELLHRDSGPHTWAHRLPVAREHTDPAGSS